MLTFEIRENSVDPFHVINVDVRNPQLLNKRSVHGLNNPVLTAGFPYFGPGLNLLKLSPFHARSFSLTSWSNVGSLHNVRPSEQTFVSSYIHSSVRTSFRPSVHTFVRPYIHSSVRRYNRPFVHTLVRT